MLNLDGFRNKGRPIEIHTTTAYGSYKPNDRYLSHHVSLNHGKGWKSRSMDGNPNLDNYYTNNIYKLLYKESTSTIDED